MKKLRELRLQAGLTLNDAATKMAEKFPTETKITGNVLGKYETGKRNPSGKTLEMLASFYGVQVDYLKGDNSARESIISYLMNYYSEYDSNDAGLPWSLRARLVNYLIGNAIVPYDVPKSNERNLLNPDQASSFDFWKSKFGWLVDNSNHSLQYLQDSYGAVPQSTFNMMLANAIAANYETELRPDVRYKDSSGKEFIDEDSEFRKRLVKRQKFLVANLREDTEPDFIDPYGKPHYGWHYTWEKGLSVVPIE